MNDMRKDFEAWYLRESGHTVGSPWNGQYASGRVEDMWLGYQAGRASKAELTSAAVTALANESYDLGLESAAEAFETTVPNGNEIARIIRILKFAVPDQEGKL